MSVHTDNAIRKARSMGAYAGNSAAADVWELSKRELVEIALRLAVSSGAADNPLCAAARVRDECEILRGQGII